MDRKGARVDEARAPRRLAGKLASRLRRRADEPAPTPGPPLHGPGSGRGPRGPEPREPLGQRGRAGLRRRAVHRRVPDLDPRPDLPAPRGRHRRRRLAGRVDGHRRPARGGRRPGAHRPAAERRPRRRPQHRHPRGARRPDHLRRLRRHAPRDRAGPPRALAGARAGPTSPWAPSSGSSTSRRTSRSRGRAGSTRLPRRGVTLSDVPEALANIFACTKVFRREFVEATGLQFPVGVRYEDQVPITRAYLAATAFDILPDVVYRWRSRRDGSSITQQKARKDDLHDRLLAVDEVARLVRAQGSRTVLQSWYGKVFEFDLIAYIRASVDADDTYYATLAETVSHILDGAPPEAWTVVDLRHRIAAWALVHEGRDTLTRLLETPLLTGNLPVRRAGDGLEADTDGTRHRPGRARRAAGRDRQGPPRRGPARGPRGGRRRAGRVGRRVHPLRRREPAAPGRAHPPAPRRRRAGHRARAAGARRGRQRLRRPAPRGPPRRRLRGAGAARRRWSRGPRVRAPSGTPGSPATTLGGTRSAVFGAREEHGAVLAPAAGPRRRRPRRGHLVGPARPRPHRAHRLGRARRGRARRRRTGPHAPRRPGRHPARPAGPAGPDRRALGHRGRHLAGHAQPPRDVPDTGAGRRFMVDTGDGRQPARAPHRAPARRRSPARAWC